MILALAACGNESTTSSSQPAENNGNSSKSLIDLSSSGSDNAGEEAGSGSGSVNGGSGSGSVSTASSDANAGAFDEKQVVSNIEVKAETYKRYSSNYLVLVLTNKSGVSCDLSVDADFYNSEGKIVGTKTDSIYAFADGTTVVASLSCDEEFAKYDYTLSAEELSYYKPVDQDLTTEVTTTSKKAIVSATNNGSGEANSVDVYVLFYKGDTLVDCNWSYMSDIKAGATSKDEVSCWADDGFDSAKAYVHGYTR